MGRSLGALLAWLATLDPVVCVGGVSSFVVVYLGAITSLRKVTGDARASKAASTLAERTLLSSQAAAILAERNADIVALRQRCEELDGECDETRRGADLMEEWARGFVRHDFNNVLVELDRVYRVLGRVMDHPRDNEAWEFARKALDTRAPWPEPAIPSPAELFKGRKPL